MNLLAVNMNSEEIPELSTNIPETFENMNLHSGICISKKDKGVICRFLTSAMDDTVSLIQNSGKLKYVTHLIYLYIYFLHGIYESSNKYTNKIPAGTNINNIIFVK